MSHDNEQEFVFSLPNMSRRSSCAIQAMRLNGDLCDVTFDVAGKNILAHRVILAANIPYFSDMFLGQPVTNSQTEIIFKNMEPFAFESLIQFAYSNEIKINAHNVRSLLIGATLLKMADVHDACTQYMSKRLHPGNALEILNFATSNQFSALKGAAEDYMLKHFVEISHSEDFLAMYLSDLKELISKDELHVTSEEEVFQAVIAWVKWSPSHRERALPQLLSTMRMPLLSYHYLSTVVAKEELVKNSASCVNMVNEAKIYWTNGRPLHSNLAAGHRIFSVDSYADKKNSTCCKNSNYLYTLCRSKGKEAYPTVVARYNLMTAEWKLMRGRTTFVEDAAVAIMGKKLYVIGGRNSIGRLLDAVQVFDIESESWSFIESFPSKICHAAAAVCSGKIYVFGGKTDGCESTKYVYCYSTETKWKYLGKMYKEKAAAHAVTINDCIYILGGHDDKKKALNSVEMFNPVKDEWMKISSFDAKLNCCSAASDSNRIYACGSEWVQFYDDCLKEWDKLCNIQMQSFVGLSLLAAEGRLYVIGKKSNVGEMFVYIYDLKTDQWTCGKVLPPCIVFVSGVAITKHC